MLWVAGRARRRANAGFTLSIAQAARGEAVVPFWLQPGEPAVTLGAEEEREAERIPEQLRRFL